LWIILQNMLKPIVVSVTTLFITMYYMCIFFIFLFAFYELCLSLRSLLTSICCMCTSFTLHLMKMCIMWLIELNFVPLVFGLKFQIWKKFKSWELVICIITKKRNNSLPNLFKFLQKPLKYVWEFWEFSSLPTYT
jgi:hypothetical protein